MRRGSTRAAGRAPQAASSKRSWYCVGTACLLIGAAIHMTWVLSRSSQLPSNIHHKHVTLTQLAQRMHDAPIARKLNALGMAGHDRLEHVLHRHASVAKPDAPDAASADAPDAASAVADSKLLPAGSAALVCRDHAVPNVNCTNAQSKGLCFGDTMAFCMKGCQQCDLHSDLLRNATQLEVHEVARLTCFDEHKGCARLQTAGHCTGSVGAMLAICKATCGFCEPGEEEGDNIVGSGACRDNIDICPYLAEQQMCDTWWVAGNCLRSCEACGGLPGVRPNLRRLSDLKRMSTESSCADFHEECSTWSSAGQCSANQGFMRAHCRASCSLCSATKTAAATGSVETWQLGLDVDGRWARINIVHVARNASQAAELMSGCADTNVECKGWQAQGECAKNELYMHANCRMACGLCSVAALAAGQVTSAGTRASAVELPTFAFYRTPLRSIMLNNGKLMPAVGFGTAGLGDTTGSAVTAALQAGYRHIDSAQAREWYREDLTGTSIQSSTIPREELFITTKIHPRHLGYRTTAQALLTSLAELGTEYLDLVLLHYSSLNGLVAAPPNTTVVEVHDWRSSWKALELLYETKRAHAIGVSNFNLQELKELYAIASMKPQVLQVHMDPLGQNRDVMEFCMQNGIQMVAYSSLGTQWPTKAPAHQNPVLFHPSLQALATTLKRSVAQVVLRWVLQSGVLVIPRSSNSQHMMDSLQLWDFELDDQQMRIILALDGTYSA